MTITLLYRRLHFGINQITVQPVKDYTVAVSSECFFLIYNKVGENNIGAPKMRNNFWYLSFQNGHFPILR